MLDLLGVIGVQTVFRTYPKTPLRAYILFNTTVVMWSCCSNVKLSKWLCFRSLLDHREAEVLLYFLHVHQCWQLPVDYYYTHIERWAHSRSFTCYIISSEVHCVNNTHHSCRWREVFWWRLLCFGLWGSCSPDGCGFRWVFTITELFQGKIYKTRSAPWKTDLFIWAIAQTSAVARKSCKIKSLHCPQFFLALSAVF